MELGKKLGGEIEIPPASDQQLQKHQQYMEREMLSSRRWINWEEPLGLATLWRNWQAELETLFFPAFLKPSVRLVWIPDAALKVQCIQRQLRTDLKQTDLNKGFPKRHKNVCECVTSSFIGKFKPERPYSSKPAQACSCAVELCGCTHSWGSVHGRDDLQSQWPRSSVQLRYFR